MFQVTKTVKGWKKVSNDFEAQWDFPNCIGSVDGKKILIEEPIIQDHSITVIKILSVLC